MCTHRHPIRFWLATKGLLAGILATMLLTLNLPAAASTPPGGDETVVVEAAEQAAPADDAVAEEAVAEAAPADEAVADAPPSEEMAPDAGADDTVTDDAEPPAAAQGVANPEDPAPLQNQEPVVGHDHNEQSPRAETDEDEAGVAAPAGVTAASSGAIKVNSDGGTEDNDNNPQALCGIFYVVGVDFPEDGIGTLEITLQSGAGTGLPYSADVEVTDGMFSHAVRGVTGHISIKFVPPDANNEKTKTVWICTDTGTLTVAKATSGAATVPAGTDFEFTVACAYGASGLPAPLAAGDSAFSLVSGGSRVITVPQAADCTVMETDPGGATSTGIAVTPIGQQTSVDPAARVAVVTVGTKSETNVTVTFDNVFDTAPVTRTLTVVKVVEKQKPHQDFIFSFDCDNGVTPADVTVDRMGGSASTVVPDGTTCAVTEENPQDAKSTTYVVDTGTATEGTTSSPVLMTADHTVTFTNEYEGNKQTLTIVKVVNGPPPAEDFVFSIVCDKGPAPASVTIPRGGGTDATTQVAGGATCTVSEANPQSATSTTYSVDGSTALEGTSVQLPKRSEHTVTFTNTYSSPAGSAAITKIVTGDLAPTSGAYEICLTPANGTTGSAAEVCETLLQSGAGTVTTTFTDLPAGVWAVSEKTASPGTTGAAPTTTINTPTVTVTDGGTATGQVTNDYGNSSIPPYIPLPGIEIAKSADLEVAEVHDVVTYTYVVTNTGNVTLTGIQIDDDVIGPILMNGGALSHTLGAGESLTVTRGYEVTQEDVERGSVTNVATAAGQPPGPSEPVTDDATVMVLTSETLVQGTGFITVNKQVKGEPGDSWYAFTAVCDGFVLGENNESFTIGPAGGSREIGVAIPEGTTCTLTEVRDGGATATNVQHDDGKVVEGNTTEMVVEDGLTEVTFVNTFDVASIAAPTPHEPLLPATGTDATLRLLLGLAALVLGRTMVRAGREHRGTKGWLRV